MYDVITIGGAVQDVFLLSRAFQLIQSSQFQGGTGACVSFGAKIDLDEIHFSTGGGATNAAVTFARLGFDTATITKIGNDNAGKSVLEDLQKNDVNTSLIVTAKKGNTGYSALLTEKGGERSVLTHRGVSESLTAREAKLQKARWIYMTSLAGNTALALTLVRKAKKNGSRIAYNPGASELKKGLTSFSPILRHLDILALNLQEAQMLTGLTTRDVKKLAKALHNNVTTFILTDGKNGAYVFTPEGESLHAGTTGGKAVSRTGAGDAFNSGVVCALMAGKSLKEALQVGTLNAESVIQHYGAKIGILKKFPGKAALARVKVRSI